MSDTPTKPEVAVPDGWVETETTTEEVFSVSKVTVTATTVVFEDEHLREQLATVGDEEGGVRRFAFASRLSLRPATRPSKPLTKLVTSRAKAGFADRLRERGMSDVSAAESRRFRVGGTEATLVRFDAACAVAEGRFAVDGWVAIWPDERDGSYLVAGGAYPTQVLEGEADSSVLLPGRFRDELLDVVRSVR